MELIFKYKEIDKNGRITEGEMKAASQEEVVNNIRKKGSTPIKVEQMEQKSQPITFGGKIKLRDLSVYCKQLHTMLNAGMPMTTALNVLEGQSENKKLKIISAEMQSKVQSGSVLSEAMLDHQKAFPPLLITMVQAGEMTGKMDEVLGRMAEHYEKENKIRSKIKGAMIYPMVLGFLAVVVVIVMLTFIMPQFVGMFESSGEELPALTKGLLSLSNSLRNYGLFYLVGLIVFIVGIRQVAKTNEGKRFFDRLKMRIPVISGPIRKIATSRFTRTLSTLLSSGIPIIQSLSASAGVTNNTIVVEGVDGVVEDIKKGMGISHLLKQMGFFPPMMISMLGIGEETGELESMLSKTADFYDEELDASISKLLSILEPVLILVMGGIVGTIVIAIMMPILNLASTIK